MTDKVLDGRVTSGGECTLVPLDLKNSDAIDQLGAIINQRWGKLDGLLANAGILGEITPAPHTVPKKWDEVMAVNLTANYRLIRCYAKEAEVTKLKVNLLNPGAMRTAMRAKAMPGEDSASLPNPSDISPLIVEMLSPSYTENDSLVTFRETDYFKA